MKRNKWNVLSISGILLPSLMAAFRSIDVGSDTVTYYRMTKIILDSSLGFSEYIVKDNEVLYYLLSNMSTYFGGMWIVFFTYQFITLTFIYLTAWYFRKQIPIWIVIWLYFCILFPYSLNIMRQIAAVSFLLYYSMFLMKGEQKKFWVCAFLSLAIHASAFIASFYIWILYCVAKQCGVNLYFYGFGYLAAILIIYFGFLQFIPLINVLGIEKFNKYSGDTYTGENGSYLSLTDMTLRLGIIAIAFIALCTKIINRKLAFIYILLIITEISFLALGLYNQFLFRVALYMTAFHFIMIPLIANSPKLQKGTIRLCNMMIVVISFIYWWWVYVHNGTNEIIPYTYTF